jgi:hypothetical protein
VKTKLAIALLLCGLVVGCGSDEEPEVPAAQENVFKMIEAFGELQHKGEYMKAWDYFSASRKEWWRHMLQAPGVGARDVVSSSRTILEPDSLAAPEEKERVRKLLEKYPPWETLKSMTPQEYYAWRQQKDIPDEGRKQANLFFHRDNVQEMVLEGGKGHIVWMAKDAERQYVILEDGKWKFTLSPKMQRDYEASKTNPEKR